MNEILVRHTLGPVPAGADDPVPVPMERLEARICELAGHLTAATCQFLLLVADFDAREGWAGWEMASCAAWLSWKCQIAPGTAREQDQQARARRKLTWCWVDDFEFAFRGLLPPQEAAVVLQALRAAMNDLDHPHDEEDDVSATRATRLKEQDEKEGIHWDETDPPPRRKDAAADLASALVEICAAYLNGKAASADNPDTYQVIIHAGAKAITADPEEPDLPEPTAHVSPETPDPALTPPIPPVSHPAHPWRCHLEDGPAISPQALRLIACNATLTTMVHDLAGNVLNVGRRTRKPPPGLRRAVRERDRYRCRFPGCESRRTDIHHIIYWSNGGQTKLSGLICLCKRHHAIVHDKKMIIADTGDGFAFYTKEGTLIPASPPLPPPDGDITACHDAAITPSTIIPPNSGERLDLHLAIWIAVTNARTKAERRQREQQAQPQAA
jgi:Domain of unknown function (DUF222)